MCIWWCGIYELEGFNIVLRNELKNRNIIMNIYVNKYRMYIF